MNDFIEDLQPLTLPLEPNRHINYDEITHAFTESIEPLQKLADLAYGYSCHIDDVYRTRKRTLERVGMRAVDLLTELATFVRDES
jgi:hypothetical protein